MGRNLLNVATLRKDVKTKCTKQLNVADKLHFYIAKVCLAVLNHRTITRSLSHSPSFLKDKADYVLWPPFCLRMFVHWFCLLARFNLIRFLQQVLARSTLNLLRLQLVVPKNKKITKKLLCYSQDVCARLLYMFVCFSCVGVRLCVGLVIKQLLALPHTSGSLSSLASHCSCHFSSFHARMTAKLPSAEQEAGWV